MKIHQNLAFFNDSPAHGCVFTLVIETSPSGASVGDVRSLLEAPLRAAVTDVLRHAEEKLNQVEASREGVMQDAMDAALAAVPVEHRNAVAQRLGVA